MNFEFPKILTEHDKDFDIFHFMKHYMCLSYKGYITFTEKRDFTLRIFKLNIVLKKQLVRICNISFSNYNKNNKKQNILYMTCPNY